MRIACLIVCNDDYSRLALTLNSLSSAGFSFPVYVKDAASDSSLILEELALSFNQNLDIHFLSSADSSIYDGMNQALDWVLAETKPASTYIWFLNCGDLVNSSFSIFLDELLSLQSPPSWCATSVVLSPSRRLLDVPTRYLRRIIPTQRMVFCHQGIFVRDDVISKNYFDPNFKISADYLQLMNIESIFGNPLVLQSSCIVYDEVGFSSNQSLFTRQLEECRVVFASRFSLFYKLFGLILRIPRLIASLLIDLTGYRI